MPGYTAAGGDDAYLAKFGSNGTPGWYLQLGTEESDNAVGVTADGDGNIIVLGSTEGEFAEGTPEGRFDVFAIKYTPDGDELWAQQVGSPMLDNPRAATVGADCTIYVTGDTRGAMPGTWILISKG